MIGMQEIMLQIATQHVDGDIIIYGLCAAIMALGIFIAKLIWRDKKDRKEMVDKAYDAMKEHTSVLSSLKTLLETTREKK